MTQMKVQIRSPSLNQALEVSLELNSTVMNLKEEIQQTHPQHPLPSNQRIIFSGKLLNNDESLDTLVNKLNQSGDSVVPIFHLVVKPSLLGPRQTPSNTITSNATNYTAQTSIHHHPALSTDTATATTASSTTSPMSNTQANNTFTNAPLYPPALPGGYQLVALNGQYYLAPVLVPAYNNTQQDTNAFMQTNTNSHFDHIGNQQQSPQRQTQYRRSSQQQAPRQQQQQQQQQQAGAANRPALVRPANAQRAASIWLALKLYFVVFILCQGASLERILLFHAIALIMFMYQTGRLRIVVHRMRVVIQEPVERNPPPPNPPQQGQQQHQQHGQNNNNSNNNSNNNNNHPPEQNAPPRATTTTTSTTNSSPSSSSSRTSQEPTTRLEVLKRGVYMFIASFWPNYGRDPRIAQAFENEQRQA